MAASLSSTIPDHPIEIPHLSIEPSAFPTSAIEAGIVSLSANAILVTRVPACTNADRPLEIELAAAGLFAGTDTSAYFARWISDHVYISLTVEEAGYPPAYISSPLSLYPRVRGWIARALIHPMFWRGAATMSIASLALAGRPLSCSYLPTTLRVGYNHAPAPAGAVLAAAKTGDLTALQAALEAGGSTEEASEVCNDGEVAPQAQVRPCRVLSTHS